VLLNLFFGNLVFGFDFVDQSYSDLGLENFLLKHKYVSLLCPLITSVVLSPYDLRYYVGFRARLLLLKPRQNDWRYRWRCWSRGVMNRIGRVRMCFYE